jgi:hypothetical protein
MNLRRRNIKPLTQVSTPRGIAESIAKPGMPQPYSVETRAAKIGEVNDMCKSMRAVLRK